jgi:hypothetical protein
LGEAYGVAKARMRGIMDGDKANPLTLILSPEGRGEKTTFWDVRRSVPSPLWGRRSG